MQRISCVGACTCLLIVLSGLSTTSTYALDFERDNSSLSISGEVGFRYVRKRNFDLDDEEEDLITVLNSEPLLVLGMEYDNDDHVRVELALEFAREWEFEDDSETRENVYTSSLSLDEAFVEFSDIGSDGPRVNEATLTLGRKSLSDSREWLYDARLDGLILEAKLPASKADLMFAVNRGKWMDSDLLDRDKSAKVTNLIFLVEHHPVKSVDIGAYALIRRDSSSDNDSPRFFGISARGEIYDQRLTFWTDLATVDGQDDDETIDGYGYDVGATLKLFDAGTVYVTLGYAFGSGDGDEDTDFRQSGLHGNGDRFGGVTSFKYYGELVDPELSNLKILTAGLGFRPGKKLSFDLVYHRYEQDFLLDEMRDSDLDMDPNGESKGLGSELDLIIGFTGFEDLTTELVVGYFQPGAAFDDADDAMMVSAQIAYEF